jgi:hypothetical protein
MSAIGGGISAMALSLGCGVTPSTDGQTTSSSSDTQNSVIGSMQVPSDFTFETTHPMELHIAGPASGSSDRIALEVRTPTQAVLYRGSITAGQNLALRVPLTADTDSVEIVTRVADSDPVSQTVKLGASSQVVSVQVGGAS